MLTDQEKLDLAEGVKLALRPQQLTPEELQVMAAAIWQLSEETN